MIRAVHHFPQGFYWGTATSSHQVEGGMLNNDWAAWEQLPGRVVQDHKAGLACDWWGGRWREDFDRAAETGQNAHRLSIEWSRVEPSPGSWDQAALESYQEIIQGALERGLMPMVSLQHFTLPQWLAERGGWLSEEIVPHFEGYVRKVVEHLQDWVGLWITINEPNVQAYLGYGSSQFPPGGESIGDAFRALRNMLLAHTAAYRAIHLLQDGAQVGLAHHYRGMRPLNARNPLDRVTAALRSTLFNRVLPRALIDGRLRLPLPRERIEGAAGAQDFYGLNYYTREHVSFDLRRPGELFGRGSFPPDADLSPGGFIANDPDGMWEALRWARRFRLPIYITENGVEDAEDRIRPRYLAGHIRQVWQAANLNWKILGYFHWTLVDNFEWDRGWTQRFGLWELDPQTQERRKRDSADFYAEICRSNSISTDMVARYAPEALPQLFPGRQPGLLG